MNLEERPYQDGACLATTDEYDKGVRRMLHVMATGTGKTIIFSKLYEKLKSRLPGQMLVLAHTKELVKQNADKMAGVNPNLKIGVDMAGEYADTDADIVSASIETLGRKNSERLTRFDWNHFDKFVIDEAHHSTGESYRRVLDVSGCLAPDTSKLLMGFTATPKRPDGLALSEVYQKVAFVYSIRDAIKDGWLVDLRGYRVKTSTSLTGVSVLGGEYNKTELSTAVNTEYRNAEIVDTWLKHGEGRQTIAFCVDIQHAQDLADAFTSAGVAATAVWGDDPDRDAKIQAHKDGKVAVICNCQVLTEGYDDWRVSCIVLARPTLSEILFAQMIGRCTRLDPNTGNLQTWKGKYPEGCSYVKTDSLVFDVVDNSTRHSLLTLPTLMGIITPLDLQGHSLIKSVEELEAAIEECPTLDITKLDNISELQTVVSQVNLFDLKFPAEVEKNSDLTWFRAATGGFKMLIPAENTTKGYVQIYENALGQWEVVAEINDNPLHGVRDSMESAFKAADEQIRKRVNIKTLACLKREATWHNGPVREKQKALLTRFFKHKEFNWDHMTAGMASKLIGERIAKFDKK